MEISEVKQILEALLFVSERPLTLKELKAIIKEDYPQTDNLENILNELKTEYDNLNKPYEIKFVADGWTFATKANFSPWIKKLLKEKTVLKLSPSALETLAVIAYKQPVTRAEIDEIRGVESSGVIDTLLDRKLIKITGRKEALGKPLLYGTTQEFLKHFGLAHLSELPLIEDIPKEAMQTDNAPEPELPFEEKEDDTNTDDADLVSESIAADGAAESVAVDNAQIQVSDENAEKAENIPDESTKND
ncbi:MAG: SMC-Scp complex subunit ScpB [Endomicrobium sp.]|jgi:segregation and condensation protein B|nr:SMC-Scp complex subunit ScpB [Endomicrobium sp.]